MGIKKEVSTAIIAAIIGTLIGAGSIGFRNMLQLEKINTEIENFSEDLGDVSKYIGDVAGHEAILKGLERRISINEKDIEDLEDEI